MNRNWRIYTFSPRRALKFSVMLIMFPVAFLWSSWRKILKKFLQGKSDFIDEAAHPQYALRFSETGKLAEVLPEEKFLAKSKKNLHILQLSDLHSGWYIDASQIAQWVKQANGYAPDVVFITGDLLDAWFQMKVDVLAPLANLQAPLGVWAVLGNHDCIRYPKVKKLQVELARYNVQLLVNNWQFLTSEIVVVGAQDYTDSGMAGEKELAHWFESLAVELARVDAKAGYRKKKILLLHNPDFLPVVADISNKAGFLFDLILSGHTHGGQICLPKIGPMFASSRYGNRYAYGWQIDDLLGDAKQTAYVSRGLGVAVIPTRLNCPNEMVSFWLESFS